MSSEFALELSDVTKIFAKDRGEFRAVDNVNLQVRQGEMVVFLGPSGCGKTTTLRMVAGFETPSSGAIRIQGKDMTTVPVNKRGIGFVFQNYALFPHMSVFKNVSYGLKARGEGVEAIRNKVSAALELVGLSGSGDKFPNQLSGGEQQRVALARVIVMEPSLLLMDEPLSNLDAKLRLHMRTEIRKLQKHLGITCMYVTHDQAEALTMADRIVVMNRGKVEQVGTPFDLYNAPRSLFVADFIGQANIVKLPVVAVDDVNVTAAIPEGGTLTARCAVSDGECTPLRKGDVAALIVRPESVGVEFADRAEKGIRAVVISAIFGGSDVEYQVSLADGSMVKASVPYRNGMDICREGSRVSLVIEAANCVFLPVT